MSRWLNDDEVLVGQGSGETVAMSPRLRGLQGLQGGSPRLSRGHHSPTLSRETMTASPQGETMGKAKELFLLCDKEGKGFITKRDMQRLQMELPLSPEQLETVFDSMDRESNGFLTPIEFNTVLGELVDLEDSTELSQDEAGEASDQVEWFQDAAAGGCVNILMELGADKLLEDQQELCSLWRELQKERPELLSVLENVLVHTVSRLQDAIRERDCLEQALCRREREHDQFVRTIYEEMENQHKEDRQRHQVQDNIKQMQRGQHLQEELKMREQELEVTLNKQKELETRIRQLTCEQANFKEQNQQLRSLNIQLQEHVETTRQQLQVALGQLSLLQLNDAQEQSARQRNVMRVSRNIQKEKESLLRQLELLRDMNKRLRDEKDAQQTQKRNPIVTKVLQKQGSIIGNYLLQEKPLKRQLNSPNELEQDKDKVATNAYQKHQLSCSVRCENVEQTQIQSNIVSPQRVFKVVFLGSSGVGKSSFIQHYCTGSFLSNLNATVGMDFQMKRLTLGSITITLQLWDTAGQERFRSITEQYYRKADGVLAMYDITHSPSFAVVRGWIDSVKEKMSEGAVLMLLGNKLDLEDRTGREVETETGRRLAEQHQALFYECSAKTGCNVEELMAHLARMLVAQDDQHYVNALLLTEETSKKGCCT